MRIKLNEELKQRLSREGFPVPRDDFEIDATTYGTVRAGWAWISEEAAHVEAVMYCLTHPNHGRLERAGKLARETANKQSFAVEKKARDYWTLAYRIAILLLLLLIAIHGHAQGKDSQIFAIKVQDNSGATVKTLAGAFTFKAGANCTPSIAGSTFTFNCTGSGTTLTEWSLDRQGGNVNAPAQNVINMGTWDIPVSVQFGNITWFSPTSDGTSSYDVGLFDSSGNLKAHTGPVHVTGALPESHAISGGGTVTISPGSYLVVVTTNCAAGCANFRGASGGPGAWGFCPYTTSTTTSTSATLPSTISVAACSYGDLTGSQVPGIGLR